MCIRDRPCSWARSNLTVDEWVRFRGQALYQPTCPDYPSQSVPGILDLVNQGHFEYLFLTIPGRLAVVGVLLLLLAVAVLPFWVVFRLVRRFLRKRRARRLAAAGDSGSQ